MASIQKKTSLRDIADSLGVSIALVSKVLNNKLGTTRVSQKLADEIHARATEMGYQQNRTARALVTGCHGVIGVFIHHFGVSGSGIVEELINGISLGADESNLGLLLHFFSSDAEFEERCSKVNSGQMDGLILAGLSHKDLKERLLESEQAGVPVVTVCETSLCDDIPNVGCNQFDVSAVAVDHLLESGAKRLACIDSNLERTQGFLDACEKHDIPKDDVMLIKSPGFSYEQARQVLEAHLDSGGPAFDALVASSDQQALAAVHVLMNRGIDIPGQIKVTGVDNSPFCSFSAVSITSVSQENRQQGRAAVELLRKKIRGEDVTHLEIPPQIFIRNSTQS